TNIFCLLSMGVLLGATAGVVKAGGQVEVDIDFATDFSDPLNISNPYWPLQPGNTFVYRAGEDDECVVNIIVVTENTKSDFGAPYDQITARVVEDKEWADDGCDGIPDGDPLEETEDWYAQDDFGHIWYFGEDTIDEEGSTEGSWEAGSDVAGIGSNAEPGIIMLAHPDVSTDDSVLAAPGLFYEQEYYEDEAEDMGKVKRLNAKVALEMDNTLVDSDYTGCLKTKEWTPLEAGAVEHKYYCPYVGLVLIEELQGGPTVRVELTDINP
ncbi:MAG: hypothetical protein ACWGQW_25520, partial [bacterium]